MAKGRPFAELYREFSEHVDLDRQTVMINVLHVMSTYDTPESRLRVWTLAAKLLAADDLDESSRNALMKWMEDWILVRSVLRCGDKLQCEKG